MRIARFVTSGELGHKTLTKEEAVEIASRFNAVDAAATLASFSLILQRDGMESHDFRRFTANLFFGPLVCMQFDRLPRSPGEQLELLFPKPFRLVIRLLLEHGQRTGGRLVADADAFRQLGELLLSAPDTFHVEVPQPILTGTAEEFLAIAVSFEHNGDRVTGMYRPEVGRVLPLKGAVLARLLRDKRFAEAFRDYHGVSPAELQAGLLALIAGFGQATVDHAKVSNALRLDYRQVFGLVGTRRQVVEYVLRNYVLNLEDPSQSTQPRSDQSSDLSVMVHKPYLLTGLHQLACLDWTYANGALARCLYKAADEALQSIGENVRDLWGDALEGYVFDQLSQIKAARPLVKVIPPVRSNEREHDGLYLENGVLVVMECKSGVVKVSTLMSGDPDQVRKELWEKFVYGRRKEKGIRQIATRIKRILAAPKEYGVKRPHTVVPLLIVEDDFIASPFVNEFIRRVSKPLFHRHAALVVPPVVISAIDLYWLAHRAPAIGLGDALIRYLRNPIGNFQSFGDWLSSEFPGNDQAAPGTTQEVKDFDPFLDEAFRILESKVESYGDHRCDACGARWVINQAHMKGPHWWCTECNHVKEPTSEELARDAEWIQRSKDKFELESNVSPASNEV